MCLCVITNQFCLQIVKDPDKELLPIQGRTQWLKVTVIWYTQLRDIHHLNVKGWQMYYVCKIFCFFSCCSFATFFPISLATIYETCVFSAILLSKTKKQHKPPPLSNNMTYPAIINKMLLLDAGYYLLAREVAREWNIIFHFLFRYKKKIMAALNDAPK